MINKLNKILFETSNLAIRSPIIRCIAQVYEQAYTRYSSGTIVRGNTRSMKRAKCRMQTDRTGQRRV